MTLKRLGLLLTVLTISAGIGADSAPAAVTTGGVWYTNGKKLAEGLSPVKSVVTCQIGTHVEKKIVITTVIATRMLKFTSSAVECPNSTIFNEGGVGKDETNLVLSNLTISEPVGCGIKTPTNTNLLKSQIFHEGKKVFETFAPASGTVIATFEITKCEIAGPYLLRGTFLGESANSTGVEATSIPITFSPSIQEIGGDKLTLGSEIAELTGQIIIQDGDKIGNSIGVKEG